MREQTTLRKYLLLSQLDGENDISAGDRPRQRFRGHLSLTGKKMQYQTELVSTALFPFTEKSCQWISDVFSHQIFTGNRYKNIERVRSKKMFDIAD